MSVLPLDVEGTWLEMPIATIALLGVFALRY